MHPSGEMGPVENQPNIDGLPDKDGRTCRRTRPYHHNNQQKAVNPNQGQINILGLSQAQTPMFLKGETEINARASRELHEPDTWPVATEDSRRIIRNDQTVPHSLPQRW